MRTFCRFFGRSFVDVIAWGGWRDEGFISPPRHQGTKARFDCRAARAVVGWFCGACFNVALAAGIGIVSHAGGAAYGGDGGEGGGDGAGGGAGGEGGG